MKILYYTSVISPHQMPLCDEIVKLIGADNFHYIASQELGEHRLKMGWSNISRDWIEKCIPRPDEKRLGELAKMYDVLMTEVMDPVVIERFKALNKPVVYHSERWYKPPLGFVRLLVPSKLKRASYFVSLLKHYDKFHYFPIGVHAAEDVVRLRSALSLSFFGFWFNRLSRMRIEKTPIGSIYLKGGLQHRIHIWGYFVGPSTVEIGKRIAPRPLKMLWAGRYLDWKHPIDIVKAVRLANSSLPEEKKFLLDMYGDGPELEKALAQASKDASIHFHSSIPIADVRMVMREHDLYILSSDAYEGWGAVVSEALEEGLYVIGTYEAGSSGTILPAVQLYHTGDIKRLAAMLRGCAEGNCVAHGIGDWSAKSAANKLVEFLNEINH